MAVTAQQSGGLQAKPYKDPVRKQAVESRMTVSECSNNTALAVTLRRMASRRAYQALLCVICASELRSVSTKRKNCFISLILSEVQSSGKVCKWPIRIGAIGDSVNGVRIGLVRSAELV